MNKADIVANIATVMNVPVSQADKFVTVFWREIMDSLSKGEDIQFVGFGTFVVKERAERVGRNPSTGQEITIPACKVPQFKVGKKLKEAVNR